MTDPYRQRVPTRVALRNHPNPLAWQETDFQQAQDEFTLIGIDRIDQMANPGLNQARKFIKPLIRCLTRTGGGLKFSEHHCVKR